MKSSKTVVCGREIPVYAWDTVVIGSGCAGYNAIDWLYDFGRRDIALLTEGRCMGTSRNTGSDKQTYYKLSLCSDAPDSVREMAETLFSGGSVNGDTALAEAAGSVRAFMKLANLGVPFPTNFYGEYVGYKTDHDPRQRATSAGPLTSKFMTERLEESVRGKNIPVIDGMQVVKILSEGGRLKGFLCWEQARAGEEGLGFALVCCNHAVLATGGAADVYELSVYPESQTGALGMAMEAGLQAANLQEWQFGMSSTAFRWNVSGTYQQVLPRYLSVDSQGREREFLLDFFSDPIEALDLVFLKGYQWPFDTAKIEKSSLIDMLVYQETILKGNRVFLDYRTNPAGLEGNFQSLSPEAYHYLKNSNALLPTPIERLEKMNPKAIELYRSHGIDLHSEPLEIAVCAQHHNGGIAVDSSWRTSVKGLFAVGEAAGTFGVYRPGGSALNSTQVGSLRAAEAIACGSEEAEAEKEAALRLVKEPLEELLKQILPLLDKGGDTLYSFRRKCQKKMSSAAAHIRSLKELERAEDFLRQKKETFWDENELSSPYLIGTLLKNWDMLISQLAVLSSMLVSARQVGSRGSGLVLDPNGGKHLERFQGICYKEENKEYRGKILVTQKKGDGYFSQFIPVRPIPEKDDWFENVWNGYEERMKRIYGRKGQVSL